MDVMLLLIPLVIIIVCVVVFFLVMRVKPRREYAAKSQVLLSPGEMRFYYVLAYALSADPFLIFAKVRIADLVGVIVEKSDPSYWRRMAPINQRHCDFVVVTKETTKPLCVIELDDSSHLEPERVKRDKYINWVYWQAGIPVVHIPVRREYIATEIRVKILAAIEKKPFYRDTVNSPVVSPRRPLIHQA